MTHERSELVDNYQAAAALGLDLSPEELAAWQAEKGERSCSSLIGRDLAEAAGHPDLLAEILKYRHQHLVPYIRLAAACNQRVPPEERRDLLGTDDLAQLLDPPSIAPERVPTHVWTTLASSEVDTHRIAVALASRSPRLLRKLTQDESHAVTRHLAGNKNLPIQAFATLAACDDETTRTALARNQSLPRDSALTLSLDDSARVRETLARDQRVLDILVLQRLAQDSEPKVRSCVAFHTSLDEPTATALLNDTDETVRKALTGNRNCPEDVLAKLFDRVSDTALLQNSRTPKEVIAAITDRSVLGSDTSLDLDLKEHRQVVHLLAMHPNASEQTFLKIGHLLFDADSRLDTTRRALLVNPSAPPALLALFADHEHLETRSLVAHHRKTPTEVLLRLATDDSELVRKKVAGNQSAPEETADMLREEFGKEVAKADSRRRETKRSNFSWAERKWHNYRGRRALHKLARENPNYHAVILATSKNLPGFKEIMADSIIAQQERDSTRKP